MKHIQNQVHMKVPILLLFLNLFIISFSGYALTVPEKTAIVEGVYKKIYFAMGLAEDRPRLIFDTKQTLNVAYMMKDTDGNPIIGFEEKAFDVCAALGAKRDEAIAYLLGHEISHHHFAHHWGTEFSSTYSVNNLKSEIKVDVKELKIFETQADERGGIYCYLAGYNVQGLTEKLLRDLYLAYGLKDSPKYPTLEERIQIAKDRDSIVSTYIKVFETANYAMLMNEYEVAIDGYEYVIGKGFHSREIYNNLGVVYFLQGIKLSDEEDIKYIYPIEIDLESRINRGATKGMGDNVRAIFEKALAKFEQATKFDKTYSTGYLNMACVYSIFKEYEDAEYHIQKAIKAAIAEGRTNVEENSLLVKAIILNQNPEGDKAEMKKIMNDLIKKGNSFAKYNQLIFDGKSTADISYSGYPISWKEGAVASTNSSTTPSRETMDNVKSYEGDLDVNFMEEILYAKLTYLICGTRDESMIYRIENKNGDVYVFHSAKSNYSGQTTKGLKIGSTKTQLIDAYGLPSVVMNARQGTVLLYPKHKMIFVTDENDCISNWTLIRMF